MSAKHEKKRCIVELLSFDGAEAATLQAGCLRSSPKPSFTHSNLNLTNTNSTFKNRRGSNCGCPLMSCLGKEDGPGRALLLQFFRQHVVENLLYSNSFLNGFYAEAFVQIVVEIVEVEHCTIQDQRKLRDVRGVDDKIQISQKRIMCIHCCPAILERDQKQPAPF